MNESKRLYDQDGDVIDILVQTKRNAQAAIRFFSRLVKTAGAMPRRLVTDKLRSYPVAHKTVIPDSIHDNERYSNNRAEVSHQPTRQHERRMRRFKSIAQAQRFLTIQGAVQNLFNLVGIYSAQTIIGYFDYRRLCVGNKRHTVE